MTDGLKASQIKGGIGPSKSFDQGRVCKDESCSTQLVFTTKEIIVLTMHLLNTQESEAESYKKLLNFLKLPP